MKCKGILLVCSMPTFYKPSGPFSMFQVRTICFSRLVRFQIANHPEEESLLGGQKKDAIRDRLFYYLKDKRC